MSVKKSNINVGEMTQEAMILYYLFVDEQLLCAWWDYLDYWHEGRDYDDYDTDSDLRKKMEETMESVEYWEDILDQLKMHITYADIEDYILDNPNVKKSFLFIRT
jgi:hypothetical protein